MRKINLILGAVVILVFGYLLGAIAVPLAGNSGELQLNTEADAEFPPWSVNPTAKTGSNLWKSDPIVENTVALEASQKAEGPIPEFKSFKDLGNQTGNAGRDLAAKTSEMYRNRRRQKHAHRVETQAALAEQQRQDLKFYYSVIVPQQQAAAQQAFNNSMQAVDRMNEQEMIDQQRQQNFILQQKVWNDQNNFWLQQSQPRGYHR